MLGWLHSTHLLAAGTLPHSLQLSRALRDHARSIPGKAQLFINAYAKALEAIPRQLCDNAGFDATDVLNKLRQKHALTDGSGKVSQCAARRHDQLTLEQLSWCVCCGMCSHYAVSPAC
jgi:hypothetical protein